MDKKAKVMENKLSRLGILGFLGLIGVGSGLPYLAVFLVFFLFLLFSNVTPDEMFQQHVNKAGLRAFYVYLTASTALILFALIRAIYLHSASALSELGMAARGQIASMGDAFGWIFSVTVCVFAFTLFYYTYREKKALDEPMFSSIRETIAESPVWGAIIVYYTVAFIGEFVGAFLVISFVPLDDLDGSLYLMLAYAMVAIVALILAVELFGYSRLGLRRQGLKRGLLWGVPVIVAVYVLAGWPVRPLLFASPTELMPLLGSMLISLIALVVMAFYNEVLCRGLVLNILMEHWGQSRAGVYRSLLVCSLMTALTSLTLLLSWQPLAALGRFVSLFSISMFLGALYLRSGNLWVTIITRCCAVAWTVVVSFLTVKGFSYTNIITSAPVMEPDKIAKQALCMALLLVPAYLLAHGVKPRPPIIIPEPEVNGHAENHA